MSVAGSARPRGARPADLRLAPAVAAAWGAGWFGTAMAPRTAAGVAASGVLAGSIALAVLLAVRRRRPSGVYGVSAAPLRTRVAAAGLVALAAATVVLASTAAQVAARTRGPLPGWAARGAVARVQGQVVDDPRPVRAVRPGAPPAYVVRVRVARADAHGVTTEVPAPVLVIGDAGWRAVTAGERVDLTGRLRPAEPGDDVVAVLSAYGPPAQVRPGGIVWRLADRLRAGLRAACRGLPEDSGGLLPSLAVGDTSMLPERVRADLQASGLTHLTAVSGANLAITAGAAGWLVARAGLGRRWRIVVPFVVVAMFVVVARPQPSVLRAAAMAGLVLAGTARARTPRGVPVLCGAAVLLLGFDPWLARSPGFALSCLATGALLLLAPAWTRGLSRRLPQPLAAAVAVPAAAQAVCGPVVVLLQPTLGLVAVPANLLAEPAVAPATMAGVVAAGVALWSVPAAHLVASAGAVATGWIVTVASRAAGLPGSALPWPPGPPGALLLAVLTAALIALTAWPRDTPDDTPDDATDDRTDHGTDDGRTRLTGRAAVAVALVAAAIAIGWWCGPHLPELRAGGRRVPAEWAVVQCDVGQGSAMVARSGPDRAVLVDAGPEPSAVDRCLRRLGVRHLDLVVLTHHHADHVDGLAGALRGRDAGEILVSPLGEPAANAAQVRAVAAAAGAPVRVGRPGLAGEAADGGWHVRWRVLGPDVLPPQDADADAEGTRANDSSLATVIDIRGPPGTVRYVGLGDLETAGQARLRERLAAGLVDVGGPVDVLGVAHHGSARQDPALCRSLSPRIGLIGVGADNDYGHPAPSALAMLHACGVLVERTDVAGDVVVVPSPDGSLHVVTAR